MIPVKKDATNVTRYVFINDSSSTTGAGLTGLVWNSSGLVASYVRPLAVRVGITLATQTVTGAHSDGGFVEVDATNMPGLYRLDLPDAACATGVDFVTLMLKGATNMAPLPLVIPLTTVDLNAADFALALTNANLAHVDASERVTGREVLQSTTILVLATQVDFTLSAGSLDDNAYEGCMVVVTDSATGTQKAVGVVDIYTGATRRVQLANDPNTFTMANGDAIDIIADRSLKPITDNRRANVSGNGFLGLDFDNSTGQINASQFGSDTVTKIRSLANGTADSGSATTLVDSDLTEADTDYWNDCWLLITSGTAINQVRLITGFNPATDELTFSPALTQDVTTNTYEILPAGAVNLGKINGVASAAQKLAISADGMVLFTVDTATFTPTVTQFEADDIAEATAEHFRDRSIMWTSGALKGQATEITAYALVGGKGKFTVAAMTEAAANNDTGIIV